MGLSERAQLEVTGDYTDQQLGVLFGEISGAVISGGIAAVEAVAGRVASMLSVARMSKAGRRAEQALTPTVLAMIGRQLIQRGESLHAVKVRRDGSIYLCPAQEVWTVEGGEDPEEWVVDATLAGAQTLYHYVALRPAWLHIIRDARPGYPWQGVSALKRAQVTNAMATAAEDALLREAQQPVETGHSTPSRGDRRGQELTAQTPYRPRDQARVPRHDGGRMGSRTHQRPDYGLEAVPSPADAAGCPRAGGVGRAGPRGGGARRAPGAHRWWAAARARSTERR